MNVQSGKKELHALRRYSTHLNEWKQTQSTHVQKPVPAEIWASEYVDGHLVCWTLRQIFLPNRLTGAAYDRFWVNDLPVVFEHVPLHQRQHMWFMHDGAPPHFLCVFRQHLNQTFGEQWIGRGGPVSWPARSPDLNSLDFWLWGRLNVFVYSVVISDLELLQ
jgi:hypothetical protein